MRRREQLANQAAANGTLRSGGFNASVYKLTEELFIDAGTGIIADFLGLASDVGNAPEALDWLEQKFGETIVQVSSGIERSLREGPSAVHVLGDHMTRAIPQAANRLKQDAAMAFGRVRLRMRRPVETTTASPTGEVRHFFISHAGEDRVDFVDLLVEELTGRGHSIWHSEFELAIGDGLLRRIDEGLRMSRYGVAILSPDFFRKPWPRAELDGLAARSMAEGRKVILPVWHKLGHDEIASHSPVLAGLVGISTGAGVQTVADAILAAAKDLRP